MQRERLVQRPPARSEIDDTDLYPRIRHEIMAIFTARIDKAISKGGFVFITDNNRTRSGVLTGNPADPLIPARENHRTWAIEDVLEKKYKYRQRDKVILYGGGGEDSPLEAVSYPTENPNLTIFTARYPIEDEEGDYFVTEYWAHGIKPLPESDGHTPNK